MQPEAPKPIDADTPKQSVPESAPQPVAAPPSNTPTDEKKAEATSVIPATAPAMMMSSRQQEAAFQTFKPARDFWKPTWRALIGLNFLIAALFIVFAILVFTDTADNELLAGAMGAPFWLLPVVLLLDTVAAAVYAFVKRPKLVEAISILKWVGISLVAAFLASIGFVVYATIS